LPRLFQTTAVAALLVPVVVEAAIITAPPPWQGELSKAAQPAPLVRIQPCRT
jgi:hypothetical protein